MIRCHVNFPKIDMTYYSDDKMMSLIEMEIKCLSLGDLEKVDGLHELLTKDLDGGQDHGEGDGHGEGEGRCLTPPIMGLEDLESFGQLIDLSGQTDENDTGGHQEDTTDTKDTKHVRFDQTVHSLRCHNSACHHQAIDTFHIYDLDDELIIICQQCHQDGYRFCLITHEILPINQLEPIFDHMYVKPSAIKNDSIPKHSQASPISFNISQWSASINTILHIISSNYVKLFSEVRW